jgi:tRNA pseudouridine38-40 synthase
VRIALGIEYVGTGFCGWQEQHEARSVQGTLQEALSGMAGSAIRVTCAGRTDAGVHALAQVVHFDTETRRPGKAWTMGVNTSLPPDLGIRWARKTDADFHARFSARSRTYQYVIHNSPSRSPLLADRAWWCRRALDAEAMAIAAGHLVGEHDFSSFRAAECQARSPVRRVLEASVTRRGDLVCLQITANAFLHHMVRNVAGTLAKVGRGDAEPEWLAGVLEGRDRRLAGVTAPPGGLYLVGVDYAGLLDAPLPNLQAIPGGAP